MAQLPPCPPGPATTWTFSDYGEPEWLLELPEARRGGWVVIAPGHGADLPAPLRSMRDLDAAFAGAPTWTDLCSAQYGYALTGHGPAMMPALTWLSTPPRRRGRPRREHGRGTRNTARLAAWLADVRGWTIARIARELTSPSLARGQDDGTARRDARLNVRAGRIALAEEGVLPWVCWDGDEDGRGLPEGDLAPEWWSDEWFLAHLDIWAAHASAEGSR